MEKTLPLRELELHKFYICALSGRKVQITHIYIDNYLTDDGNMQEAYDVQGDVYNKVTGRIETQNISEHSLCELKS